MSYNGKIFQLLEVVRRYSYLNLLWILFSVPIITISPATVAAQGVIKEWTEGNEPRITSTFLFYFKRNLKRSISVGLIQFIILGVMMGYLMIFFQLPSLWKAFAAFILLFFLVIYLIMSVYLYPLIIHFEMSFQQLFRNSFYLAVSQPFTAILNLLILSIMLVVSFILPVLFILFTFSICIMMNYKMTNSIFNKVKKVAV
ncbi:DUF624 domain-containing protein [Metabacillus dongyingensis]|uniref:YesL family protein n=1 Tax=Metabacillus dongyingensis TaxID=2874282 RepID=UPI003B8CB5B5